MLNFKILNGKSLFFPKKYAQKTPNKNKKNVVMQPKVKRASKLERESKANQASQTSYQAKQNKKASRQASQANQARQAQAIPREVS